MAGRGSWGNKGRGTATPSRHARYDAQTLANGVKKKMFRWQRIKPLALIVRHVIEMTVALRVEKPRPVHRGGVADEPPATASAGGLFHFVSAFSAPHGPQIWNAPIDCLENRNNCLSGDARRGDYMRKLAIISLLLSSVFVAACKHTGGESSKTSEPFSSGY